MFPADAHVQNRRGGKGHWRSSRALAADAREEGDGKSLALAKVLAGLLDVSSDDIFRRAMRERRRRQQRWIAGLSVAALLLAGLAIWAEINRREAVAQRAVAEEQKKIAEERRQEAERNFEIAKQGADALIFDIAQGLRDQQGMQTEPCAKSSAPPRTLSTRSWQNQAAT